MRAWRAGWIVGLLLFIAAFVDMPQRLVRLGGVSWYIYLITLQRLGWRRFESSPQVDPATISYG